MPSFLILGIVLVAAVVAASMMIGAYNGLVARRNAVENAFSTIDVQLKQRCDLVPRVVASVRGYMEHERDVLEHLTSLRASAVADGVDPATRLALDAQMGGLLTHVFARVENYPNLKAADTVVMLQRTLNEVEAQIAAARRTYNMAVTEYNTGLESFPVNIAAPALGFSRRALFEAAAADRLPSDTSSLRHTP